MRYTKKQRYHAMLEESRQRPHRKRKKITTITFFLYFLCAICIALSFILTQKTTAQKPKEVSNLIEVYDFTYWQLSPNGVDYEAFGRHATHDANNTQNLENLTLYHIELQDANATIQSFYTPLAKKVDEEIFFNEGITYKIPSNFLEFWTKSATYNMQSKTLQGHGDFTLTQKKAENTEYNHKIFGKDIFYNYQKGIIEADTIKATLELG